MTTRQQFEKAIINKSDIPNKNGYVLNTLDNLVHGISFDLFQSDLMQGSGNEMVSKFNALYSSSALAVNNFSFVKKHISDFRFLDHSDFRDAKFERQFKTGLGGTPPNLDFVIENKDTVIAFESKYLELLDKKKATFTYSYTKSNLDYLDDFWFSLIDQYRGKGLFLDVAQLIKHSIGLINYKRQTQKKVILVYIYWIPDNYTKYPIYSLHTKELDNFFSELSTCNDLSFVSITYNQFWDNFDNSNTFRHHFDNIKKRYKIEI
jgi:hypothetical protein